MKLSTDLRRGRTCVFLMHVHLVFVTKYRRKVFTQEVLDELRMIFTIICADFEACLVECEGEGDHVHLLVEYPPKVSVSKLVNSLKGVSSRFGKEDTRAFRVLYGEAVFGLPVISQELVEELHSQQFDNISKRKNLLRLEGRGFIPDLKDWVFSRPRINLYTT